MVRQLILSIILILTITLCIITFQLIEDPVSISQNDYNTVMLTSGMRTGAGVLINDEYIITAKHVASPAINDFTVEFKDGSSAQATVFSIPSTEKRDSEILLKRDLMIIKLNKKYAKKVTTQFNCMLPYVGTDVYTIGQPRGLKRYIGFGVISIDGWLHNEFFADDMEYFTTNIIGYMGNSGGGIFDRKTGALLGVMSSVEFFATNVPSPYAYAVRPQTICDFLAENNVKFNQQNS